MKVLMFIDHSKVSLSNRQRIFYPLSKIVNFLFNICLCLVGALLFERGFDATAEYIWNENNKGKLWKDIKHKYEVAEEQINNLELNPSFRVQLQAHGSSPYLSFQQYCNQLIFRQNGLQESCSSRQTVFYLQPKCCAGKR